MAKKSKIARDRRRRAVVARFATERAECKRILASSRATDDEKAAARARLARMPRDASPTRLRNRDVVDGRPHR